jgi:hypothetical protein
MMYRLIFLTGSRKGRQVTVEQEPMTVGRDPSCAIVVPDDAVAREHARVEHRPEGLFVRSAGPDRRLVVNRRDVSEVRLKHGDVVEVGRTRLLVQAVVQAEVAGAGTGRRLAAGSLKAFRRVAVAALAVVVIGCVTKCATSRRSPAREAVSGAESAAVPAPEAATAHAPEQAVAEDIRSLRRALADIRRNVQAIVVMQRETATSGAQQARSGREAGGEIERMMTQAETLEEQGRYAQAIGRWGKIATEAQAAPAPPPGEATPAALPPGPSPVSAEPRVRIADVAHHRFRENAEFQELRMLGIVLRSESGAEGFEPDRVRVNVAFYDRDPASGEVLPTRAVAPDRPITVPPPWAPGDEKTVTATYMVPHGLRPGGGLSAEFYGYAVSVYYDGVLQDQSAKPQTLPVGGAPASRAEDR